NIALPEYAVLADRGAFTQAHPAVVRCAAALMTWKAKHGAFPDRLEQAITPVPIDPFDQKQLKYRREGAGFVIYSVGKTGKFSGIAANKKQYDQEAVFRYPMPAYLKIPAAK